MIAVLRSSRSAPFIADLAPGAISAVTWRELRELPARFGKRITLSAAITVAAIATPVAAQQVAPAQPSTYQRAIAAGYKALTYCSAIFNAGRTPRQIDADELRGIYPEYDAIVPTMRVSVEKGLFDGRTSVRFDPVQPPRTALWTINRGCVLAPIGSAPPLQNTQFRSSPVSPPEPDPRPWPEGDKGIDPAPSMPLAAVAGRAFDGSSYGAGINTVGLVVVRDGQIIAERYRAGFGPFTSNRTWSVAKSVTGTLIGVARLNAASKSGDDLATMLDPDQPVTVPEWRRSDDPRRKITLDNLLRMASGLHSDTAGNRTDAIYFGGTAVDEQATAWPLDAMPGTRFRYANNDNLLAAYAMMGEAGPHGIYPLTMFRALGMQHTIVEQDWRGNYILSSQVWSTARDLARLGQFWLQDGVWQGKRLLPEGWMRYMTTPSGPQPADGPGYGATLWLFGPKQGLPEGSYAAQGNRGQYVMVIPSKRLVIVRRGEDPGAARFDIARFSADVAATLP